jgi:peptide deformylase
MAAKEILQLGNPKLLEPCEPIAENELDFARSVASDLRDTKNAFRAKYGWGRAIAAPQIGVLKQIVFMEAEPGKPVIFINPQMSHQSKEMMAVWDHCMSFPDLLIQVKRHKSCKVSYLDAEWCTQTLPAEDELSELLQHELDHLHGIIATMRAIDGSRFALQSQKDLLDEGMFARQDFNDE